VATTLQEVEEKLERTWESPPTLYGRLATVDHKKIGERYLVTAFVFLLVGGVEAAIMRLQLARPEQTLLTPEAYNQLFTMHGVTMLFWYASPVLSGFSNYLFPLVLGARDMAFPRLNAFSYWSFLLSGVFVYSSFLVGQAPDGGWFAYAPLSERAFSPGLNMDFYTIGLVFLTVSATVGAVNFIVTAFKLRAPGMSIARLPLLVWGTLTTSFSILFALPALTVACAFLYLDRTFAMHFFDPALGGKPLLWQHLFWVFGHPWVYIVVLPAMSAVSMILPTFCRRPIVGYEYVALATVTTGILGFGVWVHHMFATGLPAPAMTFFSAASLAIAVPSGVAIFAWLATLWDGRPVIRTPMLFVLGFIALFVIGGVSGVVTASVPFDWQLTDTYFVVAHLHYVLVGINVFPVMAALYYWLPKITGRMLSERLGRWNFWVMFVGFNAGFFPMHVAGLLGMPRRIYTYGRGLGWEAVNLITTVGAFVFAVGVLLFVVNFLWSRRRGELAGDNPWDASSLEWATSSPPPAYNFTVIPTVRSRDPLWEERLGLGRRSRVHEGPLLDEGRETLGTTPLDGEPYAVLEMPEDTILPLLLALCMLAICYGLLVQLWLLIAAGAILTAATLWAWFWRDVAREVSA
jgi:cytochrome c oxidase subunit I